MKATASPLIGVLTAGAMLLGLSACATDGDADAAATAERTAPTESRLMAEERGEREAVIESVNPAERTVLLRTPDGSTKTIPVPPNVDISLIKMGDVLVVSVYQSLSARVLPAGSTSLGATVKAGAPQQDPSGAMVRRLVVINEITAIDLDANTVTLHGADQQSRTIPVRNPEMQARLRTLKVGDLLELTFTEALTSQVRRRQ